MEKKVTKKKATKRTPPRVRGKALVAIAKTDGSIAEQAKKAGMPEASFRNVRSALLLCGIVKHKQAARRAAAEA